MTLTTRPSDRLPRSSGSVNRGREIRLGALGVLGILVLVVGIPTLLVMFVGYPLPRHAPSRHWLTQSISATLIIKILACVVWLVWAHFVVCLISEWRSLRRGRLPGNVAFGGGSQALARRLVAAALLLTGAATTFAQTTNSGGPVRPTISATQPAKASADAPNAQAATGSKELPATTKYYVVEPPQGRHYDCLWDIADRTLGDPLRYKEIFALNKDRIQADGSKLLDANLIKPGWELRLPADAKGPGVHVTHAHVPAAGPATDTDTGSTGAGSTGAGSTGAGPTEVATPASGAASIGSAMFGGSTSHSAPATGSLDTRLFGGALMLAGVLVALSARRGPFAGAGEDEDALAGVADTALAADLDRALRNLSAARREQGRALPQPIVAWASAAEVTISMAGGDLAEPPAPWTATADGRSWQARYADITDHPQVDETAAPYPGLVSVGREHGHELFVDVEQAPGLIALGGDAERARELATALAVQVATSVWSDGARVTLVGFGNGDEIAQLAPGSITHIGHLSAVLATIEAEAAQAARVRQQLGVDGVLTGRQARRSQAWRPHVIVLSGPPTPDETTRLQAVVGDGRSQFVAMTVGDVVDARWRFVLSPDGRLDLGVLGVSAEAHFLSRAGIAQIGALASAAAHGRAQATSAARTMTPHRALGTIAPALARPVSPQPTASVTLLGPVAVTAGGPVDAARRDLLSEIVVAVALHPDGLHDSVLRTSIWPRGVSDDVFAAAMSDAASWLGRDSAGLSALRETNGRWYAGDTVRVDWDELRHLASLAAGTTELTHLTQAIALYQGEAFSGTRAGHYSWLAFARAAREARVVGTAVARRAAELHLLAGVDEAAEQVLRRGLALVPAAEVLWRDLLTLVGRRGPDPAAAVAAEMYETLQRLRVWPEPETDALVAQLAPGYRGSDPDPAAPAMVS